MKTKFVPGDKVFAKIRGYPYWPGKIISPLDENAKHVKYQIVFYGTGENAIVKAEDVQSFIEKRNELGKPKKQKAFNDAMAEVESELSPEELVETLSPITNVKKSVGKANNKSLDTSESASTPSSETKSNRGRKRKSQVENDSLVNTLSSPETSKASRPTKPKRLSLGCTKKSKTPVSKKKVTDRFEDHLEFEHEGSTFVIPLDTNRPSLSCPRSVLDWNILVNEKASELQEKIINGDLTLEQAREDILEFTRIKALEKEKEYQENERDFIILKIEAKLLQLDVKIKKSLTITKASPYEACRHLNDVLSLPITTLMVKKHPEIIETFKRLCRYVGNVRAWKMDEDEKALFASQAEEVRNKSNQVFEKIKNLFEIPDGQGFSQVFSYHLREFSLATQNLAQEDFYSLVKDPVTCERGS